MIKARIDNEGYFISNYTPDRVQDDWIMVEQYTGEFIKPKWDGTKWVDTANDVEKTDDVARKINILKNEQFAELQPTDWYIIRQMDTGEPVPEHIRKQRACIRTKYNALIAALIE